MLNLCPKCRSFYTDADLRFCLKDGVPLVAVGENENLRREGKDFIDRTEQKIKREIFRKQIRKIVSIIITTILTILVISVITINSWLYLNPETEETAKNEPAQPETQSTVQISTEPQPSVETTTEPIPSSALSPEITETPIPETSPTAENSPEPTPTPTIEIPRTPTIDTPTPLPPTPTPTPTPIGSPEKTPPIEICDEVDKERERASIRNKYAGTWQKNLESLNEGVQDQVAKENNMLFQAVIVKLDYSKAAINVVISSDCRKAGVTVRGSWTAQSNGQNIRMPRLRRNSLPNISCGKTGSNWDCR